MKWPRVTFVQVVRSVHDAVVVDAVADAEHVSGLVDEHVAAAAQDELGDIFRRLAAEEGGIVAREAEHADALP